MPIIELIRVGCQIWLGSMVEKRVWLGDERVWEQ